MVRVDVPDTSCMGSWQGTTVVLNELERAW